MHTRLGPFRRSRIKTPYNRPIGKFSLVYPGCKCTCSRHYLVWSPPPYVIFPSTLRPPNITYMMNETRPSPFFFVYYNYIEPCRICLNLNMNQGHKTNDWIWRHILLQTLEHFQTVTTCGIHSCFCACRCDWWPCSQAPPSFPSLAARKSRRGPGICEWYVGEERRVERT